MIAVDTNILARFYCDDPSDPEAKRQRPLARRVLLDSSAVFVPLSVVLELECTCSTLTSPAIPTKFRTDISCLPEPLSLSA